MARKATTTEPVSVGVGTAAKMLDLHYDTVRGMYTRGVFTVLAPEGRGRGKRIYLRTDEVRLYGETRDEAAVREYRDRHGRIKPTGTGGIR